MMDSTPNAPSRLDRTVFRDAQPHNPTSEKQWRLIPNMDACALLQTLSSGASRALRLLVCLGVNLGQILGFEELVAKYSLLQTNHLYQGHTPSLSPLSSIHPLPLPSH